MSHSSLALVFAWAQASPATCLPRDIRSKQCMLCSCALCAPGTKEHCSRMRCILEKAWKLCSGAPGTKEHFYKPGRLTFWSAGTGTCTPCLLPIELSSLPSSLSQLHPRGTGSSRSTRAVVRQGHQIRDLVERQSIAVQICPAVHEAASPVLRLYQPSRRTKPCATRDVQGHKRACPPMSTCAVRHVPTVVVANALHMLYNTCGPWPLPCCTTRPHGRPLRMLRTSCTIRAAPGRSLAVQYVLPCSCPLHMLPSRAVPAVPLSTSHPGLARAPLLLHGRTCRCNGPRVCLACTVRVVAHKCFSFGCAARVVQKVPGTC